jgi:hypothetical protein
MHSTASACVNLLRPFENHFKDKAKFYGVEKYDDWCSARDRPELGFNHCHALKLTGSFSDRLPSYLSNMRSATPSRTLRNVPWTFDAYNELLFSRFIGEATKVMALPAETTRRTSVRGPYRARGNKPGVSLWLNVSVNRTLCHAHRR